MKKHSKDGNKSTFEVEELLGLGKLSHKKHYYQQLQETIEELEKQKDTLEQFYADSPIGILKTDADGNIIMANPAVCNILGYSNSDILLEHLRTIRSRFFAYEQDYTELLKRLNRKNFYDNIEYVLLDKDGKKLFSNISIRALKTTKRLEGLIFFIENVTEKKLYLDKIQAAMSKAEEANMAKDIFLFNMSHELRTPLNVILGITELLKESNDSNLQDFANKISNSGSSLLNLLSNILEISKMGHTKVPLSKTTFSLTSLIEKQISNISPKIEEKKLTLSFSIDSDVPRYVHGDKIKIKQILSHILTNACKFTHQGEINLQVKLKEKGEKKSYISFIIRDTGIGIQDDVIDKVFNPFVQLDSSPTREFGGSGIGLTITRNLVDLMQGTINIESHLKEGTTFEVTLPLEHGEEIEAEVFKKAERKDLKEVDIKGARVLFVEDNKDNLMLIKLFIKGLDINASFATNGQIGLDKYNESDFDMIFMDIQMPVMDGLTATKKIRETEQTEEKEKTPIIALTAHTFQEDIRKCLEAGCNKHVAKPISRKKLISVIEEFGKKSSQKELFN